MIGEVLLAVLLPLGTVMALVALQALLMKWSATSPGFRLQYLPEGSNRRIYRIAARLHPDVSQWGFHYLGCFRMNTVPSGLMAAWRRLDRPVFVCQYLIRNTTAVDVITEFDGGHVLTTGKTNSAGLYPTTPGNFMQAFPKASFDELWRRHCVAEAYLMRHSGLRAGDPSLELGACFARGLRTMYAYYSTIPLWPLRLLGWYLLLMLGKRGRSGMGIPEQHQAGLIRLPGEPGFVHFQPG